ncbi:MAG: YkgJ family cysteine cluster protein [Fluviicola sp.]|nr:YkgJ family cysteine cluster protein [Fluviicola sp.]
MKYAALLQQALADKEVYQKSVQRLKKVNPRKLDDLFHQEHTQVFKKIDCLTCANCCKTTSPIFRDIDIRRLAKRLRLSEAAFIAQYLRIDSDGDYVLTVAPCPFLGNDNYCGVYEDRPLACREYPHTDRKNMYQILDLTRKNMEVCPAVSQIMQTISKKVV